MDLLRRRTSACLRFRYSRWLASGWRASMRRAQPAQTATQAINGMAWLKASFSWVGVADGIGRRARRAGAGLIRRQSHGSSLKPPAPSSWSPTGPGHSRSTYASELRCRSVEKSSQRASAAPNFDSAAAIRAGLVEPPDDALLEKALAVIEANLRRHSTAVAEDFAFGGTNAQGK